MKETDDLGITPSEEIPGKNINTQSYQHAENVHEEVRNTDPRKTSVIFENPLANIPREKLIQDVEQFCAEFGLQEYLQTFIKGALISQNPSAALSLPELSEEDRYHLERETTHKWSQPWQLYFMACTSRAFPTMLSAADT